MRKVNAYDCPVCNKATVTVEVAEGVTPMFLNCRATKGCGGFSVSRMYVRCRGLSPKFEWYRPRVGEARKMSLVMQEYLSGGGLDIRPI